MIYFQCSNCGKHGQAVPFPGVPEAMYYDEGYRANGDALYCPDCVQSWAERNGKKFDEDFRNPQHLFAMWWNKQVQTQTADKSKIKTYRRAANGDFVEVG